MLNRSPEGDPRCVAYYGGTFDPVHRGHLTIARRLVEVFGLDEFVFVPAFIAPHKRGRRVAPAFDRYAMLALATATDEKLRISTIELVAPETPYTIDTLTRLLEEKRRERIFFVMGEDSWGEINTWREWERLLGLVDHIVVTRPGSHGREPELTPALRARVINARGADPVKVASEPHIYMTDAVSIDVSSSAVRHAIQQETPDRWRHLVPAAAADYIIKYGLYRNTDEPELHN